MLLQRAPSIMTVIRSRISAAASASLCAKQATGAANPSVSAKAAMQEGRSGIVLSLPQQCCQNHPVDDQTGHFACAAIICHNAKIRRPIQCPGYG
jgi:hypothetical protein